MTHVDPFGQNVLRKDTESMVGTEDDHFNNIEK